MSEPQPVEPVLVLPHRSGVWSWWKNLNDEDRAGRAELRRCGTVVEVAFTAPYHRLLRRLIRQARAPVDPEGG